MIINLLPIANVVRREVMFFPGVFLFTPGEGVLHLHPIILPLVPCPFWGGGLPHLHPIIFPLVPCPFWGVPQILVPGQDVGGGTLVTGHRLGWGYSMMGYSPGQGWGTHPPPSDRTADGVLDMPRSVCLLRSRSRTLLYSFSLYQNVKKN